MFLRAGMALSCWRYWRPVERMASRPAATQQKVLRRLLVANRSTRFGIEHRFADFHDHGHLVKLVPVLDFVMLRPYVEEQRRTHVPALTAESPLFYAQTSGTTGQPKFIPITASMLAIHRDEQALFSYLQYRACPAAFAGKALGIMGAAVEGHLDSGHAVGSVSAHLYRSLPGAVPSRFLVPPEVSDISDSTLT
jgi:acyl-CoA synthetase (AMP-forming)/AMP-acid ligase II